MILEMIDEQLEAAIARYLDDRYGAASFAEFASNRLGVELEANDFRNASYEDAAKTALAKASDMAPTFIQEAIDENLGSEDEADWKWQELARVAQARYGIKVTDKELRKVGRDAMSEYLLSEAEKAIDAVDLVDGSRFLEPTYGAESLADWARQKFNLEVTTDDLKDLDASEVAPLLQTKVREAYRAKDIEFPVQVGLHAYLPEKAKASGRQPNRDWLFGWAIQRFPGANIPEELIRTESRSAIKEKLQAASQSLMPAIDYPEIDVKLTETFSGAEFSEAADASELVEWAKSALGVELDPNRLTGISSKQARDELLNSYDLKYRPEMHDVERRLVLEQIDSAWKAHLLTMDHLRSTVGLSGYAQEDPKIVYKREGMKLFDQMWAGIQDRTTELAFRVEDVGDDQVQSALWAGAMAQQQQAESALRARAAQVAADQGSAGQMQTNTGGEGKKVEPIRNVGQRVGRNDPCPCGSGKKYKNCHMKQDAKR
jgi:preprotein translocase subunit SecA